MQLIANGTQGPTTPPAKQTPVGTPGYGYGGPPGSTPATDVDPDIFNTLLAELVALATATGNALDPANNAQAKGTVKTLAASNATGVTTAGTTVLTASQAGLVEVNATAGNITITLPAPASTGTVFRFEFLRVDASANTVTVTTPSGTIIAEPASAASITLPGSSLTRLICDSSNYIQDGPYRPRSNAVAPVSAITATGVTIGASYNQSQTVSFTAPCAGYIVAIGKLNLGQTAANNIGASLILNTILVSIDSTTQGQTHTGILSVASGAACTATINVATGGASPACNATYGVTAWFIPYP